jgi:hypothetical protein
LEHAQTFEVPPVFIKEDADSIVSHPEMSLKVPSWMCIAERIATGSRKRVTEDGPDTWHSDDESKTDIEADKEANMYTSEMDPTLGPQKLSPQQASLQRAAAQASRTPTSASSTDVSSDFGNSIISSPASSRQTTQPNSDDDDLGTCGAPGTRSGAVPEPPMPDPSGQPSKTQSGGRDFLGILDNPDLTIPPSQFKAPRQKAAAPQRAPADQPKGAKAPPPTKGQESPGTEAPTPRMQTRSQASRAGGLRPGGGSGQTDTCVAQGNHSKT